MMPQPARRSPFATVVVLALALSAGPGAPVSAGERPPLPVSPGATEAVSPVATGCPTFSWTYAPHAEAVEVVVYRLDATGGATPPEEAPPVLEQRLPAGAVSWTPSAERCLEPGRRFAWFVRSVTGATPGDWSEGILFRVVETGSARGGDGAMARPVRRARESAEAGREAPRSETRRREPAESPGAAPRAPSPAPAHSAASRATASDGPLFSVAGDLSTTGDYTYAREADAHLTLSPAAFRLLDGAEDDTWTVDTGGFGYVAEAPDGTATVRLVAPLVHPPDGGTPFLFTCRYSDASAAGDVKVDFRLERRLHGQSAVETLGAVTETSTGSSGEIEVVSEISFAGGPIDSTFFAYWVEGTVSTSSGTVGPTLRFYGCTLLLKVGALRP